MTYEVELKVRASHGAVREALSAAGATGRGTVEQTDTYYDAPHRDFAETDEALRVREETGAREGTRLTYKGPLLEAASKTREEHETAVADPDATREMLAELGFEPAATVEKVRERYGLDGYAVALDSVAGLGEFVEVETAAEEVAPAREGARELLRSLDLDPETQIRTSYLGLLLDNSGE